MSIKAEALTDTKRNEMLRAVKNPWQQTCLLTTSEKPICIDDCSLNTSCPYSSSKSCLPRKQENLGSRNRLSAAELEVHSQARASIRSLAINSSAYIPE